MFNAKVGETVVWSGPAGELKCEYRGRIDSETACVILDGYQCSAPIAKLSQIPAVVKTIGIGDRVRVPGSLGEVVEIQGMFYLVRVGGKVDHFHRSEVKPA